MMLYFYQNANLIICGILLAVVCMFLFPGYPHMAGRDKLDKFILHEEKFKALCYFSWVLFVENFYKFALIYYGLNALLVFQNPSTKFDTVAFQLDQVSGRAFAELLLIMISVFYIKKEYLRNFFIGLGVFESLMILFNPEGGVLFAPSFDSAFVAAIFPIAPWYLGILYCIAIIAAKGTTAYTILAAQLVAFGINGGAFKTRLRNFYVNITVAITLIGVLWMTQGRNAIDSNQRVESWKRFFSWWKEQDVAAFGTGLGTFEWLGPFLDNMKDGVFREIRPGTFIHMHNDWLQVLFETGLIGLLFALIIFVATALKARKDTRLFATWLGFGAFALTYHPLRFMLTGLFIAYIWREIYATIGRTSSRGTHKF